MDIMNSFFLRKVKNVGIFLFRKLGSAIYHVIPHHVIPIISLKNYRQINPIFLRAMFFAFFDGLLSNHPEDIFVDQEFRLDEKNEYILRLNLRSYVSRRRFYLNNPDTLAAILKERLGRESVYVDVGANIGQTSLIAACYAKRVLAFEPVTVDNFQLNLQQNPTKKNITLFPYALSNKEGAETIYLSKENDGGHSLSKGFMDRIKTKIDSTMNVQLRRFDDLHLGKVDFIKIDVEGHELAVLQGMEKALVEATYVYCETSKNEAPQVFSFLKGHGFHPLREKTKKIERSGITNILFVKEKLIE